MTDLHVQTVALVRRAQAIPYAWPVEPTAAAARASGTGSCSSKHALLAEDLTALGVESRPLLVVGPLVPELFAADPAFADGRELLEVHECLTVTTPWVGPLRVDITWDPPLIRAGLAGTLGWDGMTDMTVAVTSAGPGWSVPRAEFRTAKEALRARLSPPGERERRDHVLGALVDQFAECRAAEEAAERQ